MNQKNDLLELLIESKINNFEHKSELYSKVGYKTAAEQLLIDEFVAELNLSVNTHAKLLQFMELLNSSIKVNGFVTLVLLATINENTALTEADLVKIATLSQKFK